MGQESASRPSKPAFKPNIACHWNRQENKSKQEKPKNVQSIPKTVWLLERPEEDVSCNRENSFTEDSVLVRAEIDLTSDQNIEEIRGELQTVFKNDFESVKIEWNIIITPVVKDNHAWDFSHAKNLCGNSI